MLRLSFVVAVAVLMNAANAQGPCDARWTALSPPSAELNSYFNKVMFWDRDGAGPAQRVAVLGGYFSSVAGVPARNIATWDGSSWAPMGPGLSGNAPSPEVSALAVMPNGDLIAGGSFRSPAVPTSSAVARWTGTTWEGIGTLNGTVYALAIMPNGDIVAGGYFYSANGGQDVGNVARWNGTRWMPLGSGINDGVFALASLPNGDLIAAGNFVSAGGVECNRVARWDGVRWSPLGSGLGPIGVASSSYALFALAAPSNGGLFAAGRSDRFVNRGTVSRWDGAAWSRVGQDLPGDVLDLTVSPSGDIFAGILRSPTSYTSDGVFYWDGVRWSVVGGGVSSSVSSTWGWCACGIALSPEGDLLVGGAFNLAGTAPTKNVALFNSPCRCLADLDNDGDLGNGLTRDGAVTIEDLLSFLVGFEAGNVLVDLDNGTSTSTPDNAVDINDLLFFLARFEAGC